MGLIGETGYRNPANFFNFTDNLAGAIAGVKLNADGNYLLPIMNCHRLNISRRYAGDAGGNKNASCPVIKNTSFSWLSIPTNTTGTTQFITYSFGTSPSYSITTANIRSNPSATITSGTETRRWATNGSLETGYKDISSGFDYWEQTAQLSSYALTYLTPDNEAYIVSDFSSNGVSTTEAQRGFLGSDLSPQSVIPFSATRYVGYPQNAILEPQVHGGLLGYYYLSPSPLAYARPCPTSFVGIVNDLYAYAAGIRVAGNSVGNFFAGYPWEDVTAGFSDPSF